MKKTYYLMKLLQTAPMRISAGDGSVTDNDLKKDGRGFPMIPGSSLAGVLRAMLPPEEGDAFFGTLKRDGHIIVSDAVLRSPKEIDFEISVRDGVGLDDDGIAVDGRKFDFEVVECSAPYWAVLEVTDGDEWMEKVLESIGAAGGIRVGGRTTRGYGSLRAEIRKKAFLFPDGLKEWMGWNPFAEEAWERCEPCPLAEKETGNQIVLKAELKVEGSLTVRVFSAEKADGQEVHYTFMKARKNSRGEENAVIPGTSWAGLFRHHMKTLLREAGAEEGRIADMERLFGVVGEDEHLRSSILFAETEISGGRPVPQMRIAVDRFTMLPRDRALFSQLVSQGGKGELKIMMPGDTAPWLIGLVEACLMDLNAGILHVGGEGSVGRGIVSVSRLYLNGREITDRLKKGLVTMPEGVKA